jgi:dGTPase
MFTRSELEKKELLALAPYACRSQESKGRRFREKEHTYRTCYQRDRDRVVHSTAFRRLEYKTQVFVNHEGDHYRNRLTHSLEGAQIARTIARVLALNEDLVETIILTHDMGHGPFGHAGQDELAELMKDQGGFEHNLQTLRIVDHLENRYPHFEGLNLSYEIREGILKHLKHYRHPTQVKISEFNPKQMPSLEAQIANIADEIAYDSHDLDDGIHSGLLTEKNLSKVKLWQEAICTASKRYPKLAGRYRKHAVIRCLIDMQVSDLLKNSSLRLRRYKIRNIKDVRTCGVQLISFSKELEQKKKTLKKVLWNDLYQNYRVTRMSAKGRRVIRELFLVYISHPEQVPAGNLTRKKTDGLHRVICDYIAGMTDRYALDEYRKLFDPHEKV